MPKKNLPRVLKLNVPFAVQPLKQVLIPRRHPHNLLRLCQNQPRTLRRKKHRLLKRKVVQKTLPRCQMPLLARQKRAALKHLRRAPNKKWARRKRALHLPVQPPPLERLFQRVPKLNAAARLVRAVQPKVKLEREQMPVPPKRPPPKPPRRAVKRPTQKSDGLPKPNKPLPNPPPTTPSDF